MKRENCGRMRAIAFSVIAALVLWSGLSERSSAFERRSLDIRIAVQKNEHARLRRAANELMRPRQPKFDDNMPIIYLDDLMGGLPTPLPRATPKENIGPTTPTLQAVMSQANETTVPWHIMNGPGTGVTLNEKEGTIDINFDELPNAAKLGARYPSPWDDIQTSAILSECDITTSRGVWRNVMGEPVDIPAGKPSPFTLEIRPGDKPPYIWDDFVVPEERKRYRFPDRFTVHHDPATSSIVVEFGATPAATP